MVTLMNQPDRFSTTNQLMTPAMLNRQAQQMMMGNAALAFNHQLTLQNELYRQQLLIQQKSQQNTKDQTKTSPIYASDQKNSSVKANALLAPTKASVFSSQSILLQNQQPKHMSKIQIAHVTSSQSKIPIGSGTYQQGLHCQYTQAGTSVSKQTSKDSPFHQKMMTDPPKVSLQHKLLSAKIAKSTTLTPISSNKSHVLAAVTLKKNKEVSASSLPRAALSSRGVSIIPTKPTEVKISKDIMIGRNLTISPASSSKTKTSLSPSISKDLTVTILKSSGDQKQIKTSNTISVTLMEGSKKSQSSPGVETHNVVTPTLRMGGSISITPAKPAKTVAQIKQIPKADFSISLTNSNDSKKKDGKNVINID